MSCWHGPWNASSNERIKVGKKVKPERLLITAASKSELEQRILAVMKIKHIVTGGEVHEPQKRKYPNQRYYSNAGEHLARLLGVDGYTSTQVTNTVKGLARRGVLNLKLGVNMAGKPFGIEVISLSVSPESLYIDKQYVDELDKKIAERMAAAKPKRGGKPVADQQHLEPHEPAKKVVVVQQAPAPKPDIGLNYAELADKLLDTVITKINEPKEVVTHIKDNSEVAALKARLNAADHNLEAMRKLIDELGAENETLRNAAMVRAERGERLTSTVEALLAPEQREALKQMAKERP